VPSIAGLHGCAVPGAPSATTKIVMTAMRDTKAPHCERPRHEGIPQLNKLSAKPALAKAVASDARFLSCHDVRGHTCGSPYDLPGSLCHVSEIAL
jgi:hypothetical protein